MKKTLVAVAVIAAAGPAHAVSLLNTQYGSMDMTGRAYAGHYFGDDRESEMYGSNTYMRFGVKGRSKINDTLTAIGTYEGQLNVGDKTAPATVPTIDSEKNSTVATRLAFGGISHADYGTFAFGRQNGAANLVTSWTDVSLTDGYGNHGVGVGVDKFGTKRSSDVFKYSLTHKSFGTDLSYKLKTNQASCANGTCSDANDVEVNKDNSAWGSALTYKLLPVLSLGASYSVGKQTYTNTTTKVTQDADDASLWTLGFRYDDKALYAAFNYGQGTEWYKPGYDHDGYEAALGYSFINGVSLMAMWNLQDAEGTGTQAGKNNGKSSDTVDYYTLGARYNFNRRLSIAGEYRINNKNADSFAAVKDPVTTLPIDAANDWQLAARYDF